MMNMTINTKHEGITTIQSRTGIPPRKRTSAFTRTDWLVPIGLILLTAIPSLAGVLRLVGLAEGISITQDDAYFYVMPLPVVLHILGALPFCILGAFQFSPGFRRRWPRWHRLAGRLVVPCGITAGLSGLWMTQFYPLLQTDLLYSFRMLFGSAMVLSLALGLVAILRRDIAHHRAWMLRGYAIGQGAGTQALTSLIWVLVFGPQSELTRELLMGASWVINLVVAEWLIRRKRPMGRHKERPRVSALGHPQDEYHA
jgi:uncharacterized membrane protein